jgi:hypothetical protein
VTMKPHKCTCPRMKWPCIPNQALHSTAQHNGHFLCWAVLLFGTHRCSAAALESTLVPLGRTGLQCGGGQGQPGEAEQHRS